MIIRDLRYGEIGACTRLVTNEWGDTTGDRAMQQMIEMFRMLPSQDPPHFYVAEDSMSGEIVGFAGFKATMRMKGDYDLIWICLTPKAQGNGIGSALTVVRLDEIKRRGGKLVSLMTQKPGYFERFGFLKHGVFDGWSLMIKQLGKVEI